MRLGVHTHQARGSIDGGLQRLFRVAGVTGGGMDHGSAWARRLIVALLVALPVVAFGQSVPRVVPVGVTPAGVANGGGVTFNATYEIGAAAFNDAGVAAAANDASYVSRALTVSRQTLGRMTAAGLADTGAAVGGLAARASWLGLAATAGYLAYKWYQDNQGNWFAPGAQHPAVSCGGGDYWDAGSFGQACSVPGVQQKVQASLSANVSASGWTPQLTTSCQQQSASYALCVTTGKIFSGSTTRDYSETDTGVTYTPNAPAGTSDPAWTDPAVAVTDDQWGQLVEQNPDWWSPMMHDPVTNQPVVTPEMASQIDDIRKGLAVQQGVDPSTLPATQTDGYLNGQTTPQTTSWPSYCAWAGAACDFFSFAKENWPGDATKKTYSDSGDCDIPPSCTGDDVLCGIAKSSWDEKCALSGDGSEPPKNTEPVVGDVTNPEQDLGDTSKLDQSGFGWGTSCPFHDVSVPLPGGQQWAMSFQPVCDYGPAMHVLVLILAAVACAGILGGFSLRGLTGAG